MSPFGLGKRPRYPYHLSCDTNPSGANGSCSTHLHRTTTPSPQTASSDVSPAIPPCVCRHRSISVRPDLVSAHRDSGLGFVAQPSNRRFCGEPPETPCAGSVVSRYPALAPVQDLVLLFLPPCGPHLTPLAT
jgi:hypothetical protein